MVSFWTCSVHMSEVLCSPPWDGGRLVSVSGDSHTSAYVHLRRILRRLETEPCVRLPMWCSVASPWCPYRRCLSRCADGTGPSEPQLSTQSLPPNGAKSMHTATPASFCHAPFRFDVASATGTYVTELINAVMPLCIFKLHFKASEGKGFGAGSDI